MPTSAKVVNGPFEVKKPCNVEIEMMTDRKLEQGNSIQIQFPNTWYTINGPSFTRDVQGKNESEPHFVEVSADGARFEIEITKRHLFFQEQSGRHGRLITATLKEGSVAPGSTIRARYANTFAPYVSEVDEPWIRIEGEAPGEAPKIIVNPGPARSLRVIAPSSARPRQPFEVLVVSLDRFENCSSTTYEGNQLTLESDGRAVAEGLNFTGSIRVPVTLDEPGVYRFRFGETLSNAVKVEKKARGPYWGDIHIHTGLSSDGQGTDPYRYARETSGLDFAGLADHCESLGVDGYQQLFDWGQEAYEPGRFVTVLADERNPAHWTGHHNVYFRDAESFLAGRIPPGLNPRGKGEEREKSVENLDPATCMVIPHHTGMGFGNAPIKGIGSAVDLDAVDDRGMRPVMEIYSHHGQSEVRDPHHILSYEFNRMRNPERRTNSSVQGPFYAQDYVMAGRRMGFIGSSDEHSGQGGRRHGGIAAVFPKELTREGIFDAIRDRRCYATTGERILMEFDVDGIGMGQSEARADGSKLPLRLKIWATDLLIRVDVMRHRFGVDQSFRPILSTAPRPETLDAAYELEDIFEGPVVYYARIVQQPLEWPGMAWTSPVWVDAK